MEEVEVYPYEIDTLTNLLAKKSDNSVETISAKLHHQYFRGYFDYIRAQTIVVENNYVDQHYLEDYAAYYVRCFHPYDRFCTRLHFFNEPITKEDLIQYLEGTTDNIEDFRNRLRDSYLGFVVVKPLPQTVVGRTCLKTYPTEDRRHFPIVRSYHASLFGTTLSVESLAFQEQDQVVAACATSALWSVFQGTGKEFQHIIPSPVQITRAATEKLPMETRILPSRGLTTSMMAHAIRHVGLEPDLLNVADDYILTGTLYGYLRGRIPMILGIELWDTSTDPHEQKGFHAVAVTGFSIGKEDVQPYGPTHFKLRASRIDKIYVHDDQVGPFARMEFDGAVIRKIVNDKGDIEELSSLSTSWVGEDRQIGSVRARATILMVPVYHKIRIPFSAVHDAVMSFDGFMRALRESIQLDELKNDIEWDIYLTTNNELKEDVRASGNLYGGELREFLLQGLPRYIWRATGFQNDVAVMDLLFDGTDIEQGAFFVLALEYDKTLCLALRTLTKPSMVERLFSKEDGWWIIDWFRRQETQ